MLESAFAAVLLVALAGLALSVAIEGLMRPRPPLARPPATWALHAGLWLVTYGAEILLLARPLFVAASVSAFLLMLVLVHNAKMQALREPFVFQDYEYFTDAIRHPRLYIPFLGWWKFFAAVAGFVLAVTIGLWGETVPAERFAWSGQSGGLCLVLLSGALLLFAGNRARPAVSFAPEHDLHKFGFLASLWCYALAERTRPAAPSPFASLHANSTPAELPHLVAVQSESFFDARTLFSGIRPELLAEYDRLKSEASACGRLTVPAWGANTVRTEFAFLSGIGAGSLGVHKFNPYRAVAAGWDVATLASFLKRQGYRTVCVHPYPASFYQRDRVYPRLGFDEFIDIGSFDLAARSGPYIGDAAVADKITEILSCARGPLFVFAITMENHGPLHLEQVEAGDLAALYTEPPPAGCDDLTIYLRHLRNADRMAATLRRALTACARPAALCWYGDHVPIMPSVYAALGTPDGEVEYFIWSNQGGGSAAATALDASDLAASCLRVMRLVDTPSRH